MEGILYAEVYTVCIIIVSILYYWTVKNGMSSSSEVWLSRTILCFIINFAANLLFTLVSRIFVFEESLFFSYFFKTIYHLSLIVGVFAWCAYADVHRQNGWLSRGRNMVLYLILPAVPPVLLVLSNWWTRRLFTISESGRYVRHEFFQLEIGYLFLFSLIYAIRLLRTARHESDPTKRSHLHVASSFPLCILASWLLSFFGEAFPVICVTVMLELLLLFLGTTVRQISLDQLTQVNNRQNLMGFLNYKLENHEDDLYLLMMDVDYFKSINDQYGHLEGDNALMKVSAGLKQACGPYLPRPYIARYGGDEFIVVIEADEKAKVEALCEEIRRCIDGCNTEGRYALNMSIGVARHTGEMTAKALIHEADQRLYEIKRAREEAGAAGAAARRI